ncbi:hypothetical protein [Streptomyces triticirhizae]|uniref:hypothetical protein n=1 Tax=Streptomyces triticirhizae TaxID=2483353 RepID=UPI0011C3781B|nr:hypothetical protein [Streptomyces triticirhizae]
MTARRRYTPELLAAAARGASIHESITGHPVAYDPRHRNDGQPWVQYDRQGREFARYTGRECHAEADPGPCETEQAAPAPVGRRDLVEAGRLGVETLTGGTQWATATVEFPNIGRGGSRRRAWVQGWASAFNVRAEQPVATMRHDWGLIYADGGSWYDVHTLDPRRLRVTGRPADVARYLSALPRALERVEQLATRAACDCGRWLRTSAHAEGWTEYMDADGLRAERRAFRREVADLVAAGLSVMPSRFDAEFFPVYDDTAPWRQADRIARELSLEAYAHVTELVDPAGRDRLLEAAHHIGGAHAVIHAAEEERLRSVPSAAEVMAEIHHGSTWDPFAVPADADAVPAPEVDMDAALAACHTDAERRSVLAAFAAEEDALEPSVPDTVAELLHRAGPSEQALAEIAPLTPAARCADATGAATHRPSRYAHTTGRGHGAPNCGELVTYRADPRGCADVPPGRHGAVRGPRGAGAAGRAGRAGGARGTADTGRRCRTQPAGAAAAADARIGRGRAGGSPRGREGTGRRGDAGGPVLSGTQDADVAGTDRALSAPMGSAGGLVRWRRHLAEEGSRRAGAHARSGTREELVGTVPVARRRDGALAPGWCGGPRCNTSCPFPCSAARPQPDGMDDDRGCGRGDGPRGVVPPDAALPGLRRRSQALGPGPPPHRP